MSDFSPHSDSAFWDWYRTSIRLVGDDWRDVLSPALFDNLPEFGIRDCSPNKPFKEGREFFCPVSDSRLVLISRGGDHVDGVTQFQATGSNSPALAAAFKASGLLHEPSRVDAAIDWFEDHLFDTLAAQFKKFAIANRLSISTPGDWERGESRTLYLGSRNSPLHVRLYEKGYEQRKKGDFNAPLNWVRFEVEVKYKKSPQRRYVAGLSPSDCFRLGWVNDLCESIMFSGSKLPIPSTYKGVSDHDRALHWLLKQYGSVLRAEIELRGSAEAMGVSLASRLKEAS